MNWNEILTDVVLGVVGVVISTLGTYVTYWISKRIKDEKLKGIVSSLNDIVRKAVLQVYQTYVESLKAQGTFDEEAQKEALNRALKIIKEEMPMEVHNWLLENYDDVNEYLKTLVESSIALSKKD